MNLGVVSNNNTKQMTLPAQVLAQMVDGPAVKF